MADDAELDPRLKLFTFDFNAMINYEEAQGVPFDKFDPQDKKAMRVLLWAGIKDNLPEGEQDAFTVKEAGKIISTKNADASFKFILDRMGVAQGKN